MNYFAYADVSKTEPTLTLTFNTMETTVTLGGCDLDCTFTVSGGKFKGDHMQPADPIEVEVDDIACNGVDVYGLIEALGGIEKVETLIRETL